MATECQNIPGSPGKNLLDLLVQILVAAQCSIAPKEMWPTDYGPIAQKHGLKPYDFIVVGGGTAGSVVASRLSENPKWKVLLLEAGSDPPLESEVPYFYDTLLGTDYDWNFRAEPNPNASLALKPGAIISRGKMLGGDSGINNMVYIRGPVDDFEYWEHCGNPTWEWTNVLAYYLRSENNKYPHMAANFHCHNTKGPMPVDVFRPMGSGKSLFTGMAHDAGIPELFDANVYKYLGIVQAQGTLDKRTRSSSAKSFLIPAKHRKNLHVIKNAFVIGLKFNDDGSVGGVRFILEDRMMQAVAKKEVILSAGTINNPKILMLSGIGPQSYLENLKIAVRADLPVGYNFHDHVTVPFIIQIPKMYSNLESTDVDEGFNYFVHRNGKFGSIGVRDLFSFINTQNETDDHPNIQIGYSYYNRNDPDLYRILHSYGYELDFVEEVCRINSLYDIGILYVTLLNPLSRGFVGIRSRNPNASPLIETNYLNEPEDLQSLVEGLMFVKEMLKTDTAVSYGVKAAKLYLKRCEGMKYGNKDYFECYIRNLATSGAQPAGTTKMGPDCDPESVVDWRLRVFGVKGLRTIGSSIMPRIVRAQTYATTVMIGEKAADFIIEDWSSED